MAWPVNWINLANLALQARLALDCFPKGDATWPLGSGCFTSTRWKGGTRFGRVTGSVTYGGFLAMQPNKNREPEADSALPQGGCWGDMWRILGGRGPEPHSLEGWDAVDSRGEVDGAAARLARLEEDWTFCFLTLASSEKIWTYVWIGLDHSYTCGGLMPHVQLQVGWAQIEAAGFDDTGHDLVYSIYIIIQFARFFFIFETWPSLSPSPFTDEIACLAKNSRSWDVLVLSWKHCNSNV